MFKLKVSDGKSVKEYPILGELTIGNAQGNLVVLEDPACSTNHARILVKGQRLLLFDLNSRTGTFVNSKKVTRPEIIKPGDKITIGSHTLEVLGDSKDAQVQAESQAQAKSQETIARVSKVLVGRPEAHEASQPFISQLSPEKKERLTKEIGLRGQIHRKLIEEMNLRRLDMNEVGGEELRKKVEQVARKIIKEEDAQLPRWLDREKFLKDLLDEALGLGPLEDLLADPTVTEIMVNRKDQIYIERNGRLEITDKFFSTDDSVKAVIQRIVAPIGRRIDESSPLVDARLLDGSRVNAVIPPIAIKGPCITIRKFPQRRLTIEDLERYGTLAPEISQFLRVCVENRKNIIVSGGTGSGKTTTLNVLSSFIPPTERIVTIEDAAELKLSQEHVVSLEARPPNIEGKGAIPIRQLVINALRMRPDRIVVGECRGGEAIDMLQAMNTGHDGSLTTLHANSPRDALSRLETMVLMSGMELPIRAIREQIAAAIDIVVQQTRYPCGSRKITHICEVGGMEGDIITLNDIFLFKHEGYGPDGKTRGRFISTGSIPRFYQELKERGIPVDLDIFNRLLPPDSVDTGRAGRRF